MAVEIPASLVDIAMLFHNGRLYSLNTGGGLHIVELERLADNISLTLELPDIYNRKGLAVYFASFVVDANDVYIVHRRLNIDWFDWFKLIEDNGRYYLNRVPGIGGKRCIYAVSDGYGHSFSPIFEYETSMTFFAGGISEPLQQLDCNGSTSPPVVEVIKECEDTQSTCICRCAFARYHVPVQ